MNRQIQMKIAWLVAQNRVVELKKYLQTILRLIVMKPTWTAEIKKFIVFLDNPTKPIYTVFAKRGNKKLPFSAFSVLPIVTCPGRGECAKFCYSLKAWRMSRAFFRQCRNTLLIKKYKDVIAADFQKSFGDKNKNYKLRLYVDGDFDSLKTLTFWMDLLKNYPNVQAYGYSKSWNVFVKYYFDHKKSFPKNYVLNLSNGSKFEKDHYLSKKINELPCVRGNYFSVDLNLNRNKFIAMNDSEKAGAARIKARELGLKKVFSCPGKCGPCAGGSHACGNMRFKDVNVVIGIH